MLLMKSIVFYKKAGAMSSGFVTPNAGKPDLHDIRPFGTNRRSGCERSELPDNLEKI